MKMNLSELEIRILGCLMEKELTTPEYYPLTLNALVNACNQKSNRDPVLNLGEAEVTGGLEALGSRGLARLTTTGGRVAKYCHSMETRLGLAPHPRALLVELMLRGPQTAGELRNRAGRMAEFADLASVDDLLLELQQHGPPLVARLPRQAGRKEQRYAQLFAGMPELAEEEGGAPEIRACKEPPAGPRLAQLEGEVGTLRGELAELRREVEALIASFA